MGTIKTPLPLFDTLTHQMTDGFKSNFPYPEDFQHAINFIQSYRGSEATFNAYRREIERLLQWSAHIAKKSLVDIRQQDIESFMDFCQQPPLEWIAIKKFERFIEKEGQRLPNPAWRPFVVTISKTTRALGKNVDIKDYQISQKALKAVFAITSSFFNYLIQQNYMSHNPVAQIRQKSKFFRTVSVTPVRRLSELQWTYVITTAEKNLKKEMTEKEKQIAERTLFIMNALYGMYLRISELASTTRWQPQMGHFFRDQDDNWWFKTVGKGNKERQIAVSNAMLNALKRYRHGLGLSSLPSLGESTPLLFKTKGKGPMTSTRQIRDIVQHCFDAAIEGMQRDGHIDEAEQLKAATVHWLRHTGISEDIKTRPREHVRDDAGHSSGAITDRYIDVELRERHASGKNKRIKPEDLPDDGS